MRPLKINVKFSRYVDGSTGVAYQRAQYNYPRAAAFLAFREVEDGGYFNSHLPSPTAAVDPKLRHLVRGYAGLNKYRPDEYIVVPESKKPYGTSSERNNHRIPGINRKLRNIAKQHFKSQFFNVVEETSNSIVFERSPENGERFLKMLQTNYPQTYHKWFHDFGVKRNMLKRNLGGKRNRMLNMSAERIQSAFRHSGVLTGLKQLNNLNTKHSRTRNVSPNEVKNIQERTAAMKRRYISDLGNLAPKQNMTRNQLAHLRALARGDYDPPTNSRVLGGRSYRQVKKNYYGNNFTEAARTPMRYNLRNNNL